VRRRIDVEADDVPQFGHKLGIARSLNWRTQCGCNPCVPARCAALN
jgi:hypothetical protein